MPSLARTVDTHPGATSLLGMALLALALALGVGAGCWLALGWPWGVAFGGTGLLGGLGTGAMLAAMWAEPAKDETEEGERRA